MFESKEQRIQDFAMTWTEYAPEESDYLITENQDLMNYLENEGFFTAPASTKYHGAYEGGLYDHSAKVFERLAELTINNNLKWERDESPFIVGMFHDLCKCDQYKLVSDVTRLLSGNNIIADLKSDNKHWEYNKDTVLKGHGDKSVIILSRFIKLTEEEMLCIRYHMGAYETSDWRGFDEAIKKYPNVLWTHHADMIASKLDNT